MFGVVGIIVTDDYFLKVSDCDEELPQLLSVETYEEVKPDDADGLQGALAGVEQYVVGWLHDDKGTGIIFRKSGKLQKGVEIEGLKLLQGIDGSLWRSSEHEDGQL